MSVQFRMSALAATFAVALTPAFAQNQKPDVSPTSDTQQAFDQMASLQKQIAKLKESNGSQRQMDALISELQAISRSLGGDLPGAERGSSVTPTNTPPAGSVFSSAPACAGSALTTTSFAGSTGAISPPVGYVPSTYTTTVVGLGTYLWDINLNTAITHTACGDIDMTLKSPAGTIVTITTDNGGTNDNVFNGTLWDENIVPLNSAMDFGYINLTAATPLNAEGRLTVFRGENPNGVWTLTVADDTAANTGSVTSWSVDISTLGAAPVDSVTSVTNSTPLPIADNTTQSSTITIAGAGTYCDKITVSTSITHTFPADLDITLTSPTGTIVQLTTDNGGGSDNVFNGTLWSPSTNDPVTDHAFANLVVAPNLAPEGSFDNYLGQNPNGVWTLTITDDATTDTGILSTWTLNATTTPTPTPSAPSNFAGTTGAISDFSTGGTPVPTLYTAVVSGMGTYTWDVDLSTTITHTATGDIDMTLTSPAGTVVTITTDNGGVNDNCFNGTLWDGNVNDPTQDHVYGNNVTATPMTAEGSLEAFRGENPNGTWTLTIVDDTTGADNGSVTSWSVVPSTVPSAPVEVTTTVSNTTPLAINDNTVASSTNVVAGAGTSMTDVKLFVMITHTFMSDLDILLTSPGGTVVTVVTDVGLGEDNVFNGTTFDPDSTDPVTDHAYTTLVVATPLSPEGSFENFLGQNPNGTWTLSVGDDATIDTGSMSRWDLTIRTCSPSPGIVFCVPGISGVMACPCLNPGGAGKGCGNNGPLDDGFSGAGGGGSLSSAGVADLSMDATDPGSLSLTGTGMFAGTACIFAMGPALVVGGSIAFGAGVRCAGGSLVRLYVKTGGNFVGGAATAPQPADRSISNRVLDLGAAPIVPGTYYFQTYYRDPNIVAPFVTPGNPGCPPNFTFNMTSGQQIVWVP